ncbi:MAG TPA: phosphoribosylglycinamide formyltransferase [Actinomycetes bacterium]|nr:phosphoribosylglycinamide formyltransferase [Actinomycetes bacterium]
MGPAPSVPARLVVLVSGTGSNLAALLAAAADPGYPAAVVAVGADRSGIPALDRAAEAGVPMFVVRTEVHPDRAAWDRALTAEVSAFNPDLVVLAGFMKIVGPAFLAKFGDRTINTHPSLQPAFPGTHAVRDALDYGVKITGVTVHLVDSGVDAGPVIAQAAVPVLDGDDEAGLHERIKSVERGLLVDTVGRLARAGWSVDGRRVSVHER